MALPAAAGEAAGEAAGLAAGEATGTDGEAAAELVEAGLAGAVVGLGVAVGAHAVRVTMNASALSANVRTRLICSSL
jgi:hypothetical protein